MAETLRFDLLANDRASAVFSKVGDAAGDAESKFSKVSKALLKAGAVAAGAGIAGVVKFTGDAAVLDTKMREVVTLFGETGKAADKSLGQVRSQVKDLSNQFGVAQEELTGGLYSAISAGIPKENTFKFMQVASKAAIGGVTDVETAVDGISSTINAFGLKAKDANQVADSMFTAVKGGKTTFKELSDSLFNVAPAAAAAGVSFKEVNAGIAALTAGGTPTSVAATQMRAALTGLQAPSEALNKIFNQLGFENAQAAVKSKGLVFALDAVKDASGGNNGELQKLLGSTEAVSAANVLAGTGAKKFAGEMRAQATAAGATTDAFNVVNAGAARQFEILKTNLTNIGLTIGQAMLPAFTSASQAVMGFITGMREGTGAGGTFTEMAATIGTVLSATAGFIKQNSTVLSILAGALGSAFVAFKALMFIKSVTAAFAAFNLILVANPIGLVVVALVALGAALFIAWKKSEKFREVVTGAWSAVRNATTNAFDAVRDKVSSVIGFISGIFRGFNGPEIIAGKFAAIRENVSEAGAAIRERISAAWSAVRERTVEAWSAVVTIIGEKIAGVVEKVGSIRERVTGALAGAGTWLYSAGSELVQGLINGITSKIAALGAKMAELASKIKGYLPGSPVKTGPLMSWNNGAAGKRLVGLLADGMSDTGPVDAAMNNLASHANIVGSGSFAAGATGSTSSFGGASSGGGVVLNVTINGAIDPNATVEALHQYVKRNGLIRNIAAA